MTHDRLGAFLIQFPIILLGAFAAFVIVMLVRQMVPKWRIKPDDTVSWNPCMTGFPEGLTKLYWESPSDLIGRYFETGLGMYQVTGWDAACGSDCLDSDGTMTARRVFARQESKEQA